MEDKNISQIVLQKIKEEGIKPIPKKIFNIKRFLFWVFTFISIIIGSFSFSIVLFLLVNNDWVLVQKFGFGFVFKMIPYIWLIFLILFAFIGGFYYKKTLFGHRRNILLLISLYSFITVSFGSIIYYSGISNKIEDFFYDNIRAYRSAMFNYEKYWDLSEKGLLVGVIVGDNKDYLKIQDKNGFIWQIPKDEVFVGKNNFLNKCNLVRVIGEIKNNNFEAKIIKPMVHHHGHLRILKNNCLLHN